MTCRETKSRKGVAGFTLIELLVVVTIIVVLLALLTPGLDQAIYRAELTLCATHVKVLASGAMTYALDHGRAYPNRCAVTLSQQPIDVAHTAANGNDDRPQYRDYIDLGINGPFNCPLNKKVDIGGSANDTWILAPYAQYWGWRYNTSLHGMKRMGDRFEWQHASSGQPITYTFDVLACDDSLIITSGDWGHGTHADKDGKWVQLVFQDESLLNSALPTAATGPAGYKATFARFSGPPHTRGPVDLNFAYQDNSVELFTDVGYLSGTAGDPEGQGRIIAVPFTANNPDDADYYRQLPKK